VLKKIVQIPYFLYVSFWFILLILISFPITLVLILLPNGMRDRGMFWLMKTISYLWFVLSGILPRNINRSKVDFSKRYIITPNHQSFIDAATIYTSIPNLFKTLGKIELEKTPIYGLIYKTVVITVDRSSLAAKAMSFRKMKLEMDKGISITIFSEGTFPDQPSPKLQPFQAGGYSLAILQQVDILPLLYLDAAYRMHPSQVWNMTPGIHRAVFLPLLSTLGLDKQHAAPLKDYAELYMQHCLDYCRQNKVSDVWEIAELWLKNNPFQNEIR